VARAPASADARAVRARSLFEAGSPEEALLAIEEGWTGSDQDPNAQTVKARCLLTLGRTAEAVAAASLAAEQYTLARAFGPRKQKAVFPAGALEVQCDGLYLLGHLDASMAVARQLISHDEDNAVYWFLLTRALIDSQRYEEALTSAEEWIRRDASGPAWSRKTQALLGLKRWEEGRKAAEVTLAMRPGDPGALSLLSTACAGCNDRERALGYADKWLAAAPDSPDAREWAELLRGGVQPDLDQH
jgi:tetratricopeptide (TPR) repeat protein